ncbi:MAG: T9SS type A sorting domain-containing protein [Chitinophagales bacterium]|nr:T9SS type A sorting domain-containing protein [Bacteroidota bacterium]
MKKIVLIILLIRNAMVVLSQNDTVSYFKQTYIIDTIGTFNGGAVELDKSYVIVTNELYLDNKREVILRSIDKHTGTTINAKSLGTNEIGEYVCFTDKEVLKDGESIVVSLIKCYEYDGTNCMKKIKVIETDGEGEILWEKEYGADGESVQSRQLSKTSDGGYIIGGTHFAYGEGTDPYLLKLDSIGNIEWERVYPTEVIGAALYVYPTYDGGYIFSGYRGKGNPFAPYYKPYITRIDSIGNVLWDKVYYTEFNNINSGGFVVPYPNSQEYLFFSYIGALTGAYLVVSKMDDTGNILWEKEYPFTPVTTDFHTPPQFTSDGGFVIGGHQYNENSKTVVKLFRFTAEGDTLWTKDYDIEPSERQYIRGLLSTSDGGYLLTGLSFDKGYAWEVKIDSLGNTCWQTGCDSTYVEIVGLEELPGSAEATVLVSPNPAQDELRVNIEGKTLNYWEIYNLEGRKLSSYTAAVTDISHLVSGVYIVKVYDTEGKEYIGKILIMN